jgi:2-aminobenzoate-CoA ligase
VAVVGAPDADRGMIVQAYVVLRDPAAAGQDKAAQEKAAELQEFAKQSIAPYKYPRVVEFVTELPKTITGKTQRYRLRQLAEEKLRATPR